jgi:hypothetical protein
MKQWWKSKTVWFNAITLAIGVMGAVLGVVKSEIAMIIVTAVIALGNGVLRIWFTSTAIGTPTPAAPASPPVTGTTGVPGS